MTNYSSSIDKNEDSINNDEVNLNFLFKFLNRNKKNISLISFIFFILTVIFSFSLKRIWSGEFQIVLNSEKRNPRIAATNIKLSNLYNSDRNNDLKTQVGILESPSILIPVYEFVIAKKNLDTKKNKLPFDKWEENLKIDLEKNTSILNITYEDTDKELILAVLRKISSAYQDYSQKNVKRSQELTKKFLSEQIFIFKKKSSNSLKLAQEYALDQDLIFFDPANYNSVNLTRSISAAQGDNFINKTANQEQLLRSNTGIITSRINASNYIRRIDEQLKRIQELGNDVEKLQYIGSTIPGLKREGLPDKLSNLQQELAERNSRYTKNDKSILNIIERRELLINLIKKRSIGYLKAERLKAEAIMKASMRPKGVLLKYKELVRNAYRDEATLVSLEGQLRLIELEESKLRDPWELITKPTLSINPVGPSKAKYGLLGLLLGFSLSSGYYIYKEKKSNKIYDFDSLNSILSTNLIGNISTSDLKISNSKFKYLFDYVNKNSWKNLSLISIGDLNREFIVNISNNLMQNFEDKKEINLVFSCQEINYAVDSDFRIICASLGKLTFGQLEEYNRYFKLYNLNLNGILLIEDED